jgi:hypothetical protein
MKEAKMNIAEHKLNLIRQIDQLPEESLLELEKAISQLRGHKKAAKRKFGCMKGLVVSMADDFDAPLAGLTSICNGIFAGYPRLDLVFGR